MTTFQPQPLSLADVDLHRPEAAAALLRIRMATLWRLVRAGRLPVVRVLGHPRFRADDLATLREPRTG